MSHATSYARFRVFGWVVLVTLGAGIGIGAEQPVLVVRVYDSSGADPVPRGDALLVARAIFADAGVATTWRDCGRGGADYPCRRERGPGEIVVRILPTALATADAPSALLSKPGTPGARPLRLGFAAVDANGRPGVLATVYRDSVRRAGRRTRLAYGQLLGRAIAHEIGHLLLGGSSHGTRGLMRAEWTDTELMWNRPGDWVFTPAERDRIRAGLLMAQGPGPKGQGLSEAQAP